ncbi:chloramphenicol-sensitive protein RarD [Pullulanibacillus pueri]|uniref:Transporter n=1 Tax=Pullulanibacillus pueri TaxID=1437324 RepID=A0A8J3EL80_9BACL|nr:EamA family transporter RarD [Pullulanibacillus pueri]MBM7680789.1 chloramphenicol-sensitive protein RarD [Pullulanibacillus pueri]GGH78339.1 transporter [Pullulanibacillus pueri]
MKKIEQNEQMAGALAAMGAYFLWGVMPIYWKLIKGASAGEVLAHRIIWSFVLMLIILWITRSYKQLNQDFRALFAAKKRLLIITSASIVITVNWYTFIWAVDHGHVIQASLGYYINPLVSVLLGVFFLKEKLSLWQIVSFILALIGVLIMTFQGGVFPWISLILAISFGLYGLLKKTVHLSAMTGLTIETLIITPVALIYLFFFDTTAGQTFNFTNHPGQALLLMGAGVITAIPLLLFAAGANRISLAMIGFFQYIAPTLMLILGTLLYHEPFDKEHLFSFILIWLSLILFTVSRTKWLIRVEQRLFPKKDKSIAS